MPQILAKNLQSKLVSHLLEKGAKEIFLFGSQLSGCAKKNSDIDIGVRGLSHELFFSVWCELEDIAKRQIDLVDFDLSERFFNHLVKTNCVKKIGGI